MELRHLYTLSFPLQQKKKKKIKKNDLGEEKKLLTFSQKNHGIEIDDFIPESALQSDLSRTVELKEFEEVCMRRRKKPDYLLIQSVYTIHCSSWCCLDISPLFLWSMELVHLFLYILFISFIIYFSCYRVPARFEKFPFFHTFGQGTFQ